MEDLGTFSRTPIINTIISVKHLLLLWLPVIVVINVNLPFESISRRGLYFLSDRIILIQLLNIVC